MKRGGFRIWLLVGALSALASTVGAATLDVPLTVEEPAGVARQAEPLTFGVPLPRGLIRDVARLRLVDPDGRAVPAAFRVVNRWRADGSVQWVHADFLADVGSRATAVYRLRLSDELAPRPKQPVRVDVQGDDIRIDTGVAQFTVHRTGPFLDAPGLKGADLILRSDRASLQGRPAAAHPARRRGIESLESRAEAHRLARLG